MKFSDLNVLSDLIMLPPTVRHSQPKDWKETLLSDTVSSDFSLKGDMSVFLDSSSLWNVHWQYRPDFWGTGLLASETQLKALKSPQAC